MLYSEMLLIGGMAVVTFLCRYPAMAWTGGRTLPRPIQRTLHYLGPAVLAAVIALEVGAASQSSSLPLGLNTRVIAALVAAAVAWRTRHVWLTVFAGILTIALLRSLF